MTVAQTKTEGTRRPRSRVVAVTTALSVLSCVAIAIASSLLRNQSYYLGSVAIILCIMAPFFVSFESRRPQAREIVLIVVMCALAVASRSAFVWVPHFKPMAAVVMIAGIALGAQAGFLVGAISMLASNFLFGQGYWTPWQMLAFGLAGLTFGFLADRGVIDRRGMTPGSLVATSVASALFVLVVLGPILDTSSLFMISSSLTPEGAAAVYLAGVPVNAIHAAATFATMALLANPILGKVGRVSAKYGIARGRP